MSDPIVKGAKRNPSRPAPQSASTKSSAKSRKVTAKSAKPKPKRAAAEKGPVRKAAPAKQTSPAKSGRGTAKAAVKPAAKKSSAQPAKKAAAKPKAATPKRATPAKTGGARPAATTRTKKAAAKTQASKAQASQAPHRKQTAGAPRAAAKPTPSKVTPRAKSAARPAPAPPRQPSRDEAAALKAFERAHKEFIRGNFTAARDLFRGLIAQHAGVSEVAARARTYLTVAESRLRSQTALPRDADSLYDRGVIELNRGDFVAAQEMFERALKRDPEAADTHYALAATRARLGAVETAIQSLERAVELKPVLRVRAQSDIDLVALRNDPEFERIVFPTPRV
jgi:tetratricopeptide (TPR) repeat protein